MKLTSWYFFLKASKVFVELPNYLPGWLEVTTVHRLFQVTFHCGGFCQAEVGYLTGMGGWENRPIIWENYSDLSRGHLTWWFSKGIPPKWP